MKGLRLGAEIRALRNKRGLSLTKAASPAKLTPQHLSDIEHGRRSCGSKVLRRIAASLGTLSIILRLRAEINNGGPLGAGNRPKSERMKALENSLLELAAAYEEELFRQTKS